MIVLEKQDMKKSGFTLVELLIVIAIAAILVAIALPNYNQSVRKARRSDGQAQLLEIAGVAERIFTQSSNYNIDSDSDGTTDLAAVVALATANSDDYNFTIPNLTASSYRILATRKSAQSDDTCGDMDLTNTGVRATHDGSLTGCW